MACTSTYTCDRCHNPVEQKDLLEVRIQVYNPYRYTSSSPQYDDKMKQDWCTTCRVATGLEVHRLETPPPTPTPLTLEQVVIDLLTPHIQEAVASATRRLT